jgi:hypothetical protein
MDLFRKALSDERIAEISEAVLAHRDDERWDAGWEAAQPLVRAQRKAVVVARALAVLLRRGAFERDRGGDLGAVLFASHPDDLGVLGSLGNAFESIHDIRYLNGAPPTLPWMEQVANRLQEVAGTTEDDEALFAVLDGLASAARVLGRDWDAIAERAHARLVELRPESWNVRYGQGLFYKTRGRFAEGQAANQAATDLGGADDDSVIWNLGICATGAGDAETALRQWKSIGQKISPGRFGLPEGRYGSVKVRLAQHPLAERGSGDQPNDPGLEETIWIERLSPCHGIVRSALYQDELGVDYGDVILFDGAPITYHGSGDDEVPVFPHLATLVRTCYQIFRFGGTQSREGQLADLSDALPDDAEVYVHTEQFRLLCHAC